MKIFRTIIGLGLVLMITSCGGFFMLIKKEQPNEIQPTEGKATLVIYRGTSFGWAVKIDNFLNEKFIGQTKGKSYFITVADPGQYYLIGASENNSCAKLNLEAGKVYYLLQAIYPGFMFARTGFVGSNPDDFQKDKPDLTFFECCTGDDLPTIDKDTYEVTIADHEEEMKNDPERHEDTSNLKGY